MAVEDATPDAKEQTKKDNRIFTDNKIEKVERLNHYKKNDR